MNNFQNACCQWSEKSYLAQGLKSQRLYPNENLTSINLELWAVPTAVCPNLLSSYHSWEVDSWMI